MKRFLRILTVCMYPLMTLSMLLLGVTLFAAAFITPLTVENRTGQPLLVTPVGTLRQGRKAPLPTMLLPVPAIPSPRAGRYRLGPGESMTLRYDRDDIRLSELVLEDEQNRVRQYVADPEPTRPFHDQIKDRHILDDFESLPTASAAVLEASLAARESRSHRTVIVLVLLIGPWLTFWALHTLSNRLNEAERQAA